MALSADKIRVGLENKRIRISPFNEKQLQGSSYDVRIDKIYYRERQPNLFNWFLRHFYCRIFNFLAYLFSSSTRKIPYLYNPYSKKDVENKWKREIARPAREILSVRDINNHIIDPNDLVILISPGEMILANTIESIGSTPRSGLTTMIKSRSSLLRNFISTALCAGWGDPGYNTKWTLEVKNHSLIETIPLVVGRRVSQIVFIECEGDESYNGKYQSQEDWKSDDMLGKLYLDYEVKESKCSR